MSFVATIGSFLASGLGAAGLSAGASSLGGSLLANGLVGAGLGAGGSALTGGDIGKGAMFGGLGGLLGGGLSGVAGGSGSGAAAATKAIGGMSPASKLASNAGTSLSHIAGQSSPAMGQNIVSSAIGPTTQAGKSAMNAGTSLFDIGQMSNPISKTALEQAQVGNASAPWVDKLRRALLEGGMSLSGQPEQPQNPYLLPPAIPSMGRSTYKPLPINNRVGWI